MCVRAVVYRNNLPCTARSHMRATLYRIQLQGPARPRPVFRAAGSKLSFIAGTHTPAARVNGNMWGRERRPCRSGIVVELSCSERRQFEVDTWKLKFVLIRYARCTLHISIYIYINTHVHIVLYYAVLNVWRESTPSNWTCN